MILAVIIAIASLGVVILVWILFKIAPSLFALSSIKSLRNGKPAKLSIAQIASLNVNLPDAKKILTEEEFARVYALYKFYQAERSRVLFTPEEYAIQAAKIVVSFDKVAPFIKYSGELDPMVAKSKLTTAYDILRDLPKRGDDLDVGTPEPASRKSAWLLGALALICLSLSVCSLWLWNETQNLNAEVETLSEENSRLEIRVSDNSQKIARKDVEYQEIQNEKIELESKVDSRSIRVIELTARLNQIGYIVKGSKYYHRFEIDTHNWDDFYQGGIHFKCIEFPDDVEYWAHNVEFCKYLGYSPCPTCW